ncbi:LADA_0H09362g1_1 [Lachancea dasiensis]|uniref:Transmembrane 9 superfamily member n=1 Tax=Lachancea dasiensis TaxID=1072105 RepID=A0A1G4K322_9SACH|nr:LADA_0H09362g1_1 [Lachancea dasiensis]
MRSRSKGTTICVIFILVLCGLWKWSSSFSRTAGPPIKKKYDPFEFGWVKPNYYKKGDKVELLVNKVESDQTQFPYAYYDLPFICPPSENKKPLHLSLDEVVRGDRKWQSDYNLKFGVDLECERLCDRKTQPQALKEADRLIRQAYMAHWIVDRDMPAATTFVKARDGKKFYTAGFPIGAVDSDTGKAYLNNHVTLVIRYYTSDINKHTIVGFEVYPKSVSDYHCPGSSKDYERYELNVDEEETTFIPFTYSVYWREEFHNDWSHRWNFFMSEEMPGSSRSSRSFHWISLANNIFIVGMMSFVVTMVFMKSRGDGPVAFLASSWSTEHTNFLTQLNLVTAMGIQFLFAVLGSLIITCAFNRFQEIRRWVLTTAIVCFIFGAYASSALGTLLAPGQRVGIFFSIACGCALPGLTLLVVLSLNSIVWAKESTNALPFGTIILLMASYFVICGPLSVLGALSARRIKADHKLKLDDASPLSFLLTSLRDSARTDTEFTSPAKLPKYIQSPTLLTLTSGAAPFVVIFVELLFVYKSLWLRKSSFYIFYGFLLVNIILLCVVVAEVALIVCYQLLQYNQSGGIKFEPQDVRPAERSLTWRSCLSLRSINISIRNSLILFGKRLRLGSSSWRWKCFLAGGSVAWYLEMYSLYHLIFVLHLRDFSSVVLFVCYTSLFNFMCWCAFGSLGYLSCLWFLNYLSSLAKEP